MGLSLSNTPLPACPGFWVHRGARVAWIRHPLSILLLVLDVSFGSILMVHQERKPLICGADQVVLDWDGGYFAKNRHGVAPPPLLHLRLRGGGDVGGGWRKKQDGGRGGGGGGQRMRKPKKRNKGALFRVAEDGPKRQLPPSIRAAAMKSKQISSRLQQRGGKPLARQDLMVPKDGAPRHGMREEGYGRKAHDDMFEKEEKVQSARSKQFLSKKRMEIQKSIQLKAMIARKREKLMREYNRTLPPPRPGIEPSLIVSGIALQEAPRGVGGAENMARRAAEEARAAARKIMSAKSSTGAKSTGTGTGTGAGRGSQAGSRQNEGEGGGRIEIGSRVVPTQAFRDRWSRGGVAPGGGIVEQVSDEAVVVRRKDGSSFAFNPSEVSVVSPDGGGGFSQGGAGGGGEGEGGGARVDGAGEASAAGRKGGKREQEKSGGKAPLGKGWAFDMYEKKQEEIRKIKEAAAARRGRIEQEKKEAMDRRKAWRKKLGAKTRRGQPVMQHIIEKMTEDFAKGQAAAELAEKKAMAGGGGTATMPSNDAHVTL